MTITLLRGLPGSGKTRYLIEEIGAARAAGRPACTIVCSEFPWPSNHGAFWVHRRVVSREPNVTCALDHFVSGAEAGQILQNLEPGTVVGIEEAYAFGSAFVEDWVRASDRGVQIVAAAPSYEQVHALEDHQHHVRTFEMRCERCNKKEATQITILADSDGTSSLCDQCFEELAASARAEIVTCLKDEHPFPGEEALYQPVDLPEVEGWRLARPDTAARAEVMAKEIDLLSPAISAPDKATYLDIGCNTGFFCHVFAANGFRAKGVDATERFIRSARLLESFFRRPKRPGGEFVRYERANAYEYLRDTQQERFDITSAFAVFQWVMVQRSV
jgi:2-polyprenyl-3-methyl-5-hydroxy-6-metoxy-1,4-benzoquinol methylase